MKLLWISCDSHCFMLILLCCEFSWKLYFNFTYGEFAWVRGVNCILFVGYYVKKRIISKSVLATIACGFWGWIFIIVIKILIAFEAILVFLESLRFWMAFETFPWWIFSAEFIRWRILLDSIVFPTSIFTFLTLPNIFPDGFRFCETRGTTRIFRRSVYRDVMGRWIGFGTSTFGTPL